MKTRAECFPCFFKQACIAARMASADEDLQKKALTEVAGVLYAASLERDPPYIATGVFHKVYEVMGVHDPYAEVKEQYNRIVAGKFDELKNIIRQAVDPLRTAVKLSLAGNIIDFGILETFDLDNVIQDTLKHEPAVNDYPALERRLHEAKDLLCIVDNAGEIGFDKLLIDELHRYHRNMTITIAVKNFPIINDATMYDALFFGLDTNNRIIHNGSGHVGTFLPSCSPEMVEMYHRADIVISKGQANWESLEEEADQRVFFLLKAKCACVARALGVREGDMLIKQGSKKRQL